MYGMLPTTMGGGAASDEELESAQASIAHQFAKCKLKEASRAVHQEPGSPTHPAGVTGKLCNWILFTALSNIPEVIKTRAEFLILDGIAILE